MNFMYSRSIRRPCGISHHTSNHIKWYDNKKWLMLHRFEKELYRFQTNVKFSYFALLSVTRSIYLLHYNLQPNYVLTWLLKIILDYDEIQWAKSLQCAIKCDCKKLRLKKCKNVIKSYENTELLKSCIQNIIYVHYQIHALLMDV